jgi:hypothetical protein
MRGKKTTMALNEQAFVEEAKTAQEKTVRKLTQKLRTFI